MRRTINRLAPHRCNEQVWLSDRRYTRCSDCGTCRYYPDGYTPPSEKERITTWQRVKDDRQR